MTLYCMSMPPPKPSLPVNGPVYVWLYTRWPCMLGYVCIAMYVYICMAIYDQIIEIIVEVWTTSSIILKIPRTQCVQHTMALRMRSNFCCFALHLTFYDEIFSLEFQSYCNHFPNRKFSNSYVVQ